MEASIDHEEIPDESPGRDRLSYGWVMLPLSMLAMFASSPGQTFGISIYNEELRNSLQLSHYDLSTAYLIGSLLGAVPIFFIGDFMDRFGIRNVMLLAVTAFSLACLLLSIADGWLMLVAAFVFLRMLGPGTLAFLSANTLPFWFERRLGSVESIRQLSVSFSVATVPMINVWLLSYYSWRSSYSMWGIGLWVVLFPLYLAFFRNGPEVHPEYSDDAVTPHDALAANLNQWHGFTVKEAVRTPAFWVVSAGSATFSLTMTALSFSLVPILGEHGMGATEAATTMTVWAIAMAACQLFGGYLSDRIAPPLLIMAALISCSLTMLVMYSATSPILAALGGAFIGGSQGLFNSSTQPLWARFFGRRHLGKIRGIVMTIMVASSSLGPLIAGSTADITGSFRPALLFFALMPLPIAVCAFMVRPPVRKTQPQNPTEQSV